MGLARASLIGGAAAAYQIDNSLIFNDDDSAYLSWTPSSAGNQKTGTFRTQLKIGDTTSPARLFSAWSSASNRCYLSVNGSFYFVAAFVIGGSSYNWTSDAVFRDCAAFGELVVGWDTTQAASADRLTVEYGGVELTGTWSTAIPQNTDTQFFNNVEHTIGTIHGSTGTKTSFLDGYLAEPIGIDGTKATASDFSETNLETNQWIPKAYTGSYGTNGFFLPFTNDAALGLDYSNDDVNIAAVTGAPVITYDGAFRIYTFNASGTINFPADETVEYLVIAGGGGGGSQTGGGGGAGGYLTDTGMLVTAGAKTITVGDGGAVSNAGDDSVFNGVTSIGGGTGGTGSTKPPTGGSGGGAIHDQPAGGDGTVGQGNDGGHGTGQAPNYGAGGGGGAGAVGANGTTTAGGNGGVGLASSITGSSVTRAGGGGGGTFSGGTLGTGGLGGGGTGGTSAGTANTGGGGGGQKNNLGGGYAGGSGVVIIRQPITTNDWTTSGITADDQTTDTPTNNFCTLNPLDTSLSGAILSEGNLHIAIASAAYDGARGTIQIPTTGTWYFEFTPTNIDYNKGGIATHDFVLDATLPHTSSKACVYNDHATYVSVEGVNKTSYWSVAPDTATVGVCVDMDAGTISWQNTTDGRGSTHSFDATLEWYPFAGAYTGELNINFGQKAFTLTPPSGFLALSTANLPEPDIILSGEYFKALTYTGNEVAIGSGGNAITGVGFQPDLVWMKSRDEGTVNYTGHNSLIDSVRGVGKSIYSNLTNAESVVQAESLSTFDTDGFTLGNKESVNYLNDQFISWNWKESALAGFDIVSYTGTGSAHTEAHSLGVVPDMIIVKNRDGSANWPVYHSANTAAPETDVIYLNLTNATSDTSVVWNDTAPTSSVFSVATHADVNSNTVDYIAYLFASVEGFSKFGSYTGNGSTDGPFVNCNMKVGYLRIKRTDTTSSWMILDVGRSTFNVVDENLYANSSNAEVSGASYEIDFVSNGFKIRNAFASFNASGGTYIYMAFAEAPFKYANAR